MSERIWWAPVVDGIGRCVWGTSPGGHGPVGWRQRARLANNAASGCAAAQAIRTRLAVSTLCAATLIRRIRKVVNSAVARRWGLGIVSRTLSISHWAPVCTWRHSGSRSNGGRQVPVSGPGSRWLGRRPEFQRDLNGLRWTDSVRVPKSRQAPKATPRPRGFAYALISLGFSALRTARR